MSATSVINLTRPGMEVHTADDVKLGKVAQVWYGTDAAANSPFCDEELCSRVEVHQRAGVLYIPSNMLERISGRWVILRVDAATVEEHDWTRRPAWIPAESAWGPLGRTDPLHT